MPKSLLEFKNQEIRYRDRIIILLVVLFLGLMVAYLRIPTSITVHQTPDASKLLSHSTDFVPSSAVYSFARLVLENIYTCVKDCEKDIPANVDTLRSYVTDACRNQIKARVVAQPNLYRNRVRTLKFLFNPSTQKTSQLSGESPIGLPEQEVEKVNQGKWNVLLNYNMNERVNGFKTIDTNIGYPARIIASDLPRNINQYGFSFDCFYRDPTRQDLNIERKPGVVQ